MYGEYFQHILKNRVHHHFPNFDKTSRITIEDGNSFITVIREFHPNSHLGSSQLRRMKTLFFAYLKRRSGSLKTSITPCTGTIGRWSQKRSAKPIMEMSYSCYDRIFYKNWIECDTLDRITWSNVIPIVVTESYCPYGSLNGIIFIID